jgi:hypothetical protein
MPVESPTYWNYLKAAFNRKVNVPLLGPMPVNKMALASLAVLGLANPGFWLLAAGGELLYLYLKSSSPRFQNLLKGERLLAQQKSWTDKLKAAVERLTPEGRARYRRLVEQCRLVLGISESLDEDSLGSFRDLRAHSLNQLLAIFLRLLISRQAIATNVETLDRAELTDSISVHEARLAKARADSALERSIKGTLDIQRKRLENLTRAGENLQVIDAELERIEQQVELIREETAVTGDPEVLSMRLDAVTSTMTETTRWMDQHAEFLSTLGGSEIVSALPDLPDLPEPLEEPASEDQFEAVKEAE